MEEEKFLYLFGGIFGGTGLLVAFVFSCIPEFRLIALFPLAFALAGAGVIIGGLKKRKNRLQIRRNGTRYAAKIYSYLEDHSISINGSYPVNIKVHYFDFRGIEREAILKTQFVSGSGMYPIGMTIDIFELEGRYEYDPNSVRDEILPHEEELMDDKPIDPTKGRLVAVNCPNCASSFQATAGYSNRCPFCGSYLNVKKV